MKLAIIVTCFPRTTETFIMRDVVKFLELGHDVRLYHLLPFDHHAKLHAFAASVAPRARTAPFLSSQVLSELMGTFSRQRYKFLAIVKDLFRKAWRDPELLLKSLAILPKSLVIARELQDWGAQHIHGEFAGHPTTCAWAISRLTGISYSTSCRAHDVFVSQVLLGLTVAEADAVRTITNFNVRFLRDRVPELRNKPIHMIHSSVAINEFPLLPVNHNRVISVLYVGSLQPRKGVDDLLRALAAFDPQDAWILTVIGEGSERRKLTRLADRLSIADRVNFQGALPFEQVQRAYVSANLVVVPSTIGRRGRTEGIPNVVIEALAYARPVISTRVSGIPELIEDGVTGILVEPNDPTALTKAIAFVYQHRGVADAMALQGRARVEREFNLDKSVRAQLAMFQEAVDAGSPNSAIP